MTVGESYSRPIALLGSVWGFGVVLMPIGVVIVLLHQAAAPAELRPPFHLGGAYAVAGAAAMFVAGSAAFAFARSQPGQVARAVLLAGLAYVLVFPLYGLAGAVVSTLLFGGSTVQIFVGRGINYWWGYFASFGLSYLLGIVCAAAIYSPLSQRLGTAGFRAGPAVTFRARRRRYLLAGGALVILGVVLAVMTLAELVFEIGRSNWIANDNPQWAPQFQSWATYLESELWSRTILRGLPFVLVGALLLLLAVRQYDDVAPGA